MEKLSLTVRIPALDGSYDFIVPSTMSVNDALELMLRILNSEFGVSDRNVDVMLFDEADGSSLRPECSFAQLGVPDGAKLLMI